MPVRFSHSDKKSKKQGISVRKGKYLIVTDEKPAVPAGAIRIVRPDQQDAPKFQLVTGKPQGIVQGIAQQLNNSDLDLSKITVDVSNQIVTLKGQVASRNSLLNALKTIHAVEGVERVNFQVKFRNGRQNSGFYSGPHGGGEPPDFPSPQGPHGGGGGPDE